MVPVSDLNWAAAFIAAEGHVSFSSCLRIKVTQMERAPLKHLQDMFPGTTAKRRPYPQKASGTYYRDKTGRLHTNSPDEKPVKVYHWDAYGRMAAGIMMTLYPLMHHDGRKKQIRDCLDKWWAQGSRVKPRGGGAPVRVRFRCPKGHRYVLVAHEPPTPCTTHDGHYLRTCPKCGSVRGMVGFPRSCRCIAPKSSESFTPREDLARKPQVLSDRAVVRHRTFPPETSAVPPSGLLGQSDVGGHFVATSGGDSRYC